MTALYKQTENSQQLNNNFNTKNTVLDANGCKRFQSGFTMIEKDHEIVDRLPTNIKMFWSFLKSFKDKNNFYTPSLHKAYNSQANKHVSDRTIRNWCSHLNKVGLLGAELKSKNAKKYMRYFIEVSLLTKTFIKNPNHIIHNNQLTNAEKLFIQEMLAHNENYQISIGSMTINSKKEKVRSRRNAYRLRNSITQKGYLQIIYIDNKKHFKLTEKAFAIYYNNVEKPVENNSIPEERNGTCQNFPPISNIKPLNNTEDIVLGSDEPKTEFKNVFEELRKKLGPGIYQNWIARCNFKVKDNQLIITSPSKYHQDWSITHYSNIITYFFNKHFNTKFELCWEVDKDCIPNKELLVEEETSNIQPNVTSLDSKRKENNKIRKSFDEWLSILDTNYGHDIIEKIEVEIFKKRPQLQSSTTMLGFSFIENQIKLMKIRFPNQNKMTPDMFVGAVSSFIAKEKGNIAEMSKNNHCPRIVANC